MMECRNCGGQAEIVVLDLGSAPLSNRYLTSTTLWEPEPWYPLRLVACATCWLVQTEVALPEDEIFTPEYAYLSSTSPTWLAHAAAFTAAMVDRLSLTAASRVVEVAANDGYLLQFVQQRAIPCLGVEPTASTAAIARERGIAIAECFLTAQSAVQIRSEFGPADLVIANNVLAHVPDLADFVSGLRELLAPHGVLSLEFPHLCPFVEEGLFDTAYHEHYSYLSLHAVADILRRQGLAVIDVERIPTHGGSLRVLAQRATAGTEPTAAVASLCADERARGVLTPEYYAGMQGAAERTAHDLLTHLLAARAAGRCVVGYGAAAKGNTLLNFAGVRPNLLEYVVDRSAWKIGRFLPGSRIPIHDEQRLRQTRPAEICVLPWNLAAEVGTQLAYTRDWGARVFSAVPRIREVAST